MTEHFQVGDRSFELGRTVGDAKRLLRKATDEVVFVVVVNLHHFGTTLFVPRSAFLQSIKYLQDDDPLISHLNVRDDSDGGALFVGSSLAIDAIRDADAQARREAAAA